MSAKVLADSVGRRLGALQAETRLRPMEAPASFVQPRFQLQPAKESLRSLTQTALFEPVLEESKQ
jgi:hypothetical protein